MLVKADNILAVAQYAARSNMTGTAKAHIIAVIEQLEIAGKALSQ